MAERTVWMRGLRKCYRDVVAVDSIDLDIFSGEIFALLGPNGAGKTTVVEILEGYRRRTSGEVAVLGVDPERAGRAWRSRIGIVLQDSNERPTLSVQEMLAHFAKYFPRRRDVDEVIAAVGLGEKTRTRIAHLSGGQRRRLDVALGIIGNPELLFLDEPTTGFAPEARRQFWQLVRQLADGGTTIVLTTHYLEEAEALANRLAVIVRGQVLAVDTPKELGGRTKAMARVSWDGGDGLKTVETANPGELVVKLREEFGGNVPELSVTRPSLEDVYLSMIGKEL